MVAVYKRNVALQSGLNREISDAELERILKQQGYTWEKFEQQLKDQILLEKFVVEEQKAMFSPGTLVKEEEIQEYYDSNRTRYPIVSPEMMQFKQILIMTKGLPENEKAQAQKKAEQIYRELSGGAAFDRYLEVYLDNQPGKKIGGISFETWRRDDEAKKVTYGKSFFDRLFKLGSGSRSEVISSTIGYHIVEVIEKIPFRVLSLDDKIPPQNNTTVSEYIGQMLEQIKHGEVLRVATVDLVEKLKKKAEIQVMDKNLDW